MDGFAELDALVDRALRGEEVLILRDGAPVARIVPTLPTPSAGVNTLEDALGALETLRRDIQTSGGSTSLAEVLAWREDGRR